MEHFVILKPREAVATSECSTWNNRVDRGRNTTAIPAQEAAKRGKEKPRRCSTWNNLAGFTPRVFPSKQTGATLRRRTEQLREMRSRAT